VATPSVPAWLRQLAKFGIVGLGTNLSLYAGYVLLLSIGVRPVVAMTVTYALGVLLGFLLNRAWTFAATPGSRSALARYASAYLVGYVLNVLLLAWFVDRLGWPAAYVQAGAIVVVALFLFVAQKFWVFPAARD
jgi:putative flippase GtrA